jgi:hypothetical protein
MHRSGTSLATSWLEACGLPIHQGRVWGPSEGNDLGHFEDIDFEELHRGAILRRWPDSLGWVAEESVVRFSRHERKRARSLVSNRRALPAWGWKDPRSVLFLDEWTTLAPDLLVIAIVRPREQVIDSLLRRSAIAARSARPNPHLCVTEEQAERAFDVYEAAMDRARARHRDRIMVFQLAQLLDDDRSVFEEIQGRTGGALRHVPVGNLYRPEKLQA